MINMGSIDYIKEGTCFNYSVWQRHSVGVDLSQKGLRMKVLEQAHAANLNNQVEVHSQSNRELGAFDLRILKTPATEILKKLMPFRRVVRGHESCRNSACPTCMAPHIKKVQSAVAQNQVIQFVLPAFPGKSPNLAKVLGANPDMAERLSLQFLHELCEQIKEVYAPGAHIILCSDGRVFSDVVQIPEEDITQYQIELDKIIEELNLTNLSTFNLDQVCEIKSFDELRIDLMEEYGQSLEILRRKVKAGAQENSTDEENELNRLYCGMTRFLVEDLSFPGQSKSRTAIQKDCRKRAYEVIRRSNAWSALLAEVFPQAVRLSIHPQSCGSQKFGIQLIGIENWMTPWHGVAVKTEEGFTLMKRFEVEKLQSNLVKDSEGRPSHFELVQHNDSIYRDPCNEL